ncbi:MAG: family 78 glycoside hydrolase catalytic domain [Planctomycetes bacterium]|nr:family 78 glycoside hydrolase catalytic domain [Planctomycetota bacterium]
MNSFRFVLGAAALAFSSTTACASASSSDPAPPASAASTNVAHAGPGLSVIQDGARAPQRLRVEYLENPLGLDETKPRFSWELDDARRGATQSAYELAVASSRDASLAGNADVWSSGRVASDATNQIEYAGPALQFDRTYWWRVRSIDGAGKESPWSAPATWSMGPLAPTDWKGAWIADPHAVEKPKREHHGWRSTWKEKEDDMVWVQVDLGQQRPVEAVRFYPAHPCNDPKATAGWLFPRQYRVWISEEPTFLQKMPIHVVDETAFDVPNPGDEVKVHKLVSRTTCRYLRIGFLKLAKAEGQGFGVALSEIELVDLGAIVSKGAGITASESFDGDGWSLANLFDGDKQSHLAIDVAPPPAPMLRGEFELAGPVKRATAYVTALGLYELHLNGAAVGDHVLAPEWTRYDGRVQCQAYDVTALLNPGRNAAGALLGDGWYAGKVGLLDSVPGSPRRGVYGDKPLFLMQLEVDLANGQHARFSTNPEWRSTLAGPIRSNDLLDGETYDARRELAGWDRPGFDAKDWTPVAKVGDPDQGIYAQPCEPMRVVEELHAVAITELAPKTWIVDFGRNVTGRCRIELAGAAGSTVTLRHGEVLDTDGQLYTANLRGALQTDRYTFRGGGREAWEPRFTLHGFRYVELTGLATKPALGDVVARVVRTSARETAGFESSEPVLDGLWRNARASLAGNLTGVATDCPQRDERLGWMGDLGAFAQTAMYQMDLAAFFGKWAQDVRDAAASDGRFSDFAPNPFAADGRFIGSAAWSDAGISVPWTAYVNYGDRRLLERHYAAMRRHLDFLMNYNRQFRWEYQRMNDYGDWLNGSAIVGDGWKTEGCAVDKELFATAFLRASARQMSRIALLLTGQEDPTQTYQGAPTTYGDYSVSAKNAFQAKWMNPEGRIQGETQAGDVLALAFDLAPDYLRPKIAEHLRRDIEARGNQLTTGFHTTHRALIELARAGIAADGILCETRFPALGWQLEQGATTMWERRDAFVPGRGFQDAGMNSFDHFAFGSVGEWMMGWLVGMRPDEKQPGWKHFVVAPAPTAKVTHAKGWHATLRGRVEVAWRKSDGVFELDVTVPANTSATVVLPTPDGTTITEGGAELAKAAPHATLTGREGGSAVIEVRAGTYRFRAAR